MAREERQEHESDNEPVGGHHPLRRRRSDDSVLDDPSLVGDDTDGEGV